VMKSPVWITTSLHLRGWPWVYYVNENRDQLERLFIMYNIGFISTLITINFYSMQGRCGEIINQLPTWVRNYNHWITEGSYSSRISSVFPLYQAADVVLLPLRTIYPRICLKPPSTEQQSHWISIELDFQHPMYFYVIILWEAACGQGP
jgi:hypothetical protein